jgi:alpha-tubulin suppressor-like RCC1 family protein
MHVITKSRPVFWAILLIAASGAVCLADPQVPKPALPAFPGAEGFGAKAVGGRGGRVIKVTTLKPSGPGSLQAACAAEGPRIVVFEVSGVIPSTGEHTVRISNPYITIAGQTAPGAGITLDGMLAGGVYRQRKVNDVIVRFLRMRPTYGEQGGGSGDCSQIGFVDRIILDHCSCSGGNDENMDFCGTRDLTVQWCTIEESRIAHEGSGLHNYGMILGYVAGDATLHHNLFAHHSERAPLCGLDTLDHRNNVIYNVAAAIQYHPIRMNRRQRRYRLNLVGTYFKAGPGGPIGVRPWLAPENRAVPGIAGWKNVQVYGKGNYWDWAGKYDDYDPRVQNAPDSKFRTATPWPMPPVTTHDAKEAYRLVLAQAGCLPRDAISRRTIREVRTGTGYWGVQMPAGGLMQGLTPAAPPKDSDDDGMPDAWETAHGLDPDDASDAARVVPAGASAGDRHKGYTYVEFYVNERADQLIEAAMAAARTGEPAKPPAAEPSAVRIPAVGAAPARPPAATRAPVAAAGAGHTLLADAQGRIWAWGLNWRGELADGTGKDSRLPIAARAPDGKQPLTGLTAIVSSGAHVLARRADGTLLGWGFNRYGQVGDGRTADKTLLPVAVRGPGGEGRLTAVKAIAAGCYHSLAVRTDGTVWAWGHNLEGRLGDGTRADRHTPVQVTGPGGKGVLDGVVAVAAGVKHSVALKADGTVWCWGDNLYGELGDGTHEDRLTPTRVPGLTGVTAVAAGWHHSLALRADGSVWAWGCNHYGQLGDGTTLDRSRPVRVKGPGGKGALSDVVALRVGGLHCFAVRADGTIWGWGWNYRGQIGDGTSVSRSAPVRVLGPAAKAPLPAVAALAAGGAHTVAVRKDGSVLSWGDALRGQIGDDTTVAWMKDGAYVEKGTRSTSQMYKAGFGYFSYRPWPMPTKMPQ